MSNFRGVHIRNRRGVVLLTVVAMGVLFLPGCEQKSIGRIMLDPHQYSTQEVAIVGRVVMSFAVMGRGAYEVDDGTGTLWVVSQSGVPRQGAHVGAKGTIRDFYTIGSLGPLTRRLPPGVRAGVVMVETARRVKE